MHKLPLSHVDSEIMEPSTMSTADHPLVRSLVDRLIEQTLAYLPPDEVELIRRACDFAIEAHGETLRDSGEPYVTHPLHVALILSEFHLDAETISAALLHDVLEDTPVSAQELTQSFGPEITRLVEGVTKLERLPLSPQNSQAANIRKVFIAAAQDIRVLFIKLADRLHNMRTLQTRRNPASRYRSATEALEIYARIADRLGIALLRRELEDLAFQYLYPEEYAVIARQVEYNQTRFSEKSAQIIEQLTQALRANAVPLVEPGITPNPRRVYSLYRKLQETHSPNNGYPKRVLEQLRFHVIVEDVGACYNALAVIHTLWPPLRHEFRDYIATPRANGYRSIHTTVLVDRQPVKFQIRTPAMHAQAHLGVLALWPEHPGGEVPLVEALRTLQSRLVEWSDETSDAQEFVESLQSDYLSDQVYVFTPKWDIIELPRGATPIDFAYHVHTSIGHRCRGAIVNGRWTRLNEPLHDGDQVLILTGTQESPNRDWLDPSLNYIQTAYARRKIRRWFRRQPREFHLTEGRKRLEHLLRRWGISLSPKEIARRIGYPDEETMLAAIGACELEIETYFPRLLNGFQEEPPEEALTAQVLGTGGRAIRRAPCCNPLPPHDIVGYITDTHLVEVHTSDCPTFIRLVEEDPTRAIELQWGTRLTPHILEIHILSYDRPGLLKDIWEILDAKGINVQAVNLQRDEETLIDSITIRGEISDIRQLNHILALLEHLPAVIEAQRIQNQPAPQDPSCTCPEE